MLQKLIEFMTPVSCLGCEREGTLACAGCLLTVPVKPGCCYNCNTASYAGKTCSDCRAESALDGVVVACGYDGLVKDLVWQLKYERARMAATPLAGLLAERVDYQPMIVTAVPVAPVRYRERGYNQSELIAKQLSRRLGRPYLATMGRTTREHQVGKSRAERLQQIQGVFYPTRELHGEKVLIVDDVITTGATLAECAAVLRAAGASEVWAAAVARN